MEEADEVGVHSRHHLSALPRRRRRFLYAHTAFDGEIGHVLDTWGAKAPLRWLFVLGNSEGREARREAMRRNSTLSRIVTLDDVRAVRSPNALISALSELCHARENVDGVDFFVMSQGGAMPVRHNIEAFVSQRFHPAVPLWLGHAAQARLPTPHTASMESTANSPPAPPSTRSIHLENIATVAPQVFVLSNATLKNFCEARKRGATQCMETQSGRASSSPEALLAVCFASIGTFPLHSPGFLTTNLKSTIKRAGCLRGPVSGCHLRSIPRQVLAIADVALQQLDELVFHFYDVYDFEET
jgi:hypothetical protein